MQTTIPERRDRLAAIEQEARQLLADLDDLGQYQAAAYVAMAIDAMNRVRRDALPTDL